VDLKELWREGHPILFLANRSFRCFEVTWQIMGMRERHKERHRDKYKHTHTHTERERDRETERQKEGGREIERKREKEDIKLMDKILTISVQLARVDGESNGTADAFDRQD
jgi:hypothetical protein